MRIRQIKNIFVIALAVTFAFGTVACKNTKTDIENNSTVSAVTANVKTNAELASLLQGKVVADKKVTNEGTVIETYTDGTIVETKADGTTSVTKVDGTKIEVKANNGDVATATQVTTQAQTEAPTQAPTEVPTETPTQAPTQAPTEAQTQTPAPPQTEAPTQAPMLSHAEAIQAFLNGFNDQRAKYGMAAVSTTNSDLNAICLEWATSIRNAQVLSHSGGDIRTRIFNVLTSLGIVSSGCNEGVGTERGLEYRDCYNEGYSEAVHVQVANKVVYAIGVNYVMGPYKNYDNWSYWCVEVAFVQ